MMSEMRSPWALLTLAVLAASTPPLLAQEDAGWPREIRTDATTIVVYQPQIDSWEEYRRMLARAAVTITPDGQPPILAALHFSGDTETDFETRQVFISNLQVTEATFPSLPEEGSPQWRALLEEHLPLNARTIALDRMLAMVETSRAATRTTQVSVEPPPILVSKTPAILVLLDGEPMLAPIEETELKVAINTNWDLLYDTTTERYFLLSDGVWMTGNAELGDWKAATELPEQMASLPDNESWAEVRASLPLAPTDTPAPTIFVSTRPAELIVLDGDPRMSAIEGTHLVWVENTESDLFFQSDESAYYFLVSGRWFRSGSLSRGEWEPVSGDLPSGFGAIPSDHPMAHVRAAVPGTSEANQAVLQAQIPVQAEVKRSAASLDVTYNGDPEFKPIEGTDMAYAVNSPYDVIRVGALHYVCFEGVWFVSISAHGPYGACDSVPPVIYEIPPSEPVHHVTYVYVYNSTPDIIVYGYTWGYHGIYVYNGCVVYGTGYYYPPYRYASYYPIYYPYSYSYGVSARYNHYTGTYVRGATVYGPYGGYGRGATYNPRTGTYARGAAAWGPAGGTWAAEAYNPRTGVHGATRQSRNSYEHWGESVVTRGDKWAHTGHYATSDGKGIAGFETSEGTRGVAVRGENGSGRVVRSGDDLYVGKDGGVYKREGDDWSRYDDGDWSEVDRSGKDQRAAISERRQDADRKAADSTERAARSEQARERASQSERNGTARERQRSVSPPEQHSRERVQQLDRDRSARQEGTRRTEKFQSRRGESRSRGNVQRGSSSGSSRRGGRRRR